MFGAAGDSGMYAAAGATGAYGRAGPTGMYAAARATGAYGGAGAMGTLGAARATGTFGAAGATGAYGGAGLKKGKLFFVHTILLYCSVSESLTSTAHKKVCNYCILFILFNCNRY